MQLFLELNVSVLVKIGDKQAYLVADYSNRVPVAGKITQVTLRLKACTHKQLSKLTYRGIT